MMKPDTDFLIQELSLVDTLNGSLSKEMPLDFSLSIDPPRSVALREACLHRTAEIAESAYEAFVKERLVVAFILSRSFMETEALFWAFVEELDNAIQTRKIDKIRQFLSKSLVGVTAAPAPAGAAVG